MTIFNMNVANGQATATLIIRVGAVALAVCLSLLLSACGSAPVTGRQQLMLISEPTAIEMGTKAYQQALESAKINGNGKYVAQVRRVGRYLADVTERTDYAWEFNVIDDDKVINAFALPGGKVAVYSGLLRLDLSDDELAAVMGHEIAHAIAQHSRERLSQQMGLVMIMQALGAAEQSPQNKVLMNLALGIGVGLPFERRQESEADRIGLDLMVLAGYDPRAAISFWKKMQNSGGNQPPEILSSHPSDQRRIQDLEAALPGYSQQRK